MRKTILTGLLALLAAQATALEVPQGIASQLPPGHEAIAMAETTVGARTRRTFRIVALARRDEPTTRRCLASAPVRPLLVFERDGDGSWRLAGRNDRVVMRADQAAQCDPFRDDGTIATSGVYFTVENGVSCGQHWTDFVTFRFDEGAGRWIFDNRRTQSWSFNPSQDPDAEAIVPDGPVRVQRADRGRPVALGDWRPPAR